MAFHFLASDVRILPGIDFVSRTLLRFGVALLGARIAFEQVAAVGIGPVLLVILDVAATIYFGARLGRRLDARRSKGC